jgi:hypothetical protein
VTAEGEQRPVVAVEERFERRRRPSADPVDEVLVGCEAMEPHGISIRDRAQPCLTEWPVYAVAANERWIAAFPPASDKPHHGGVTFELKRRISVASVGAVLGIGALAALALATYCEEPPPPPSKSKCNSGNGNGSETITFNEGDHCYGGDPGNSFNAGNKGGDEIPTSGGVPNPGGNNVD